MTAAALPTLFDRLQTSPRAKRLQSGRCSVRLFELFERLVHVRLSLRHI